MQELDRFESSFFLEDQLGRIQDTRLLRYGINGEDGYCLQLGYEIKVQRKPVVVDIE